MSPARRRPRPRACLPSVAILCLLVGYGAGAAAQQLVVKQPAPKLAYPADPAAADRVADVVVALVVDEQGRVVDAHVHEKRPADVAVVFDAAALAFVNALAFEPVVVNGTAVRIATQLTLHFEPPADRAGPRPAPPPDDAAHDHAAHTPDTAKAEADVAPVSKSVVDLGAPGMTARVKTQKAPVAASDHHIHVGKLGDVPRRNATEMLSLAPGILLTNHGGEGHAPAVFLRGFNAGEGQDLEFKVDGVPLNEMSNPHSHGYADAHFVIPEVVDELRVVEGPFDPRQGDFAVAGSIEYHLGLHQRGLVTKLGYGQYDQQRLLLAFGPKELPDTTFAALELKRGTNFGANRAYSAAGAIGQFEASPAPGTTVTVTAQSYASRFDSAGVLRQDDVLAGRVPGCASDPDAQFFCTYDPNQGGASQRHSGAFRIRQRLGREVVEAQLYAVNRSLRLRENFTGFVNDVRLDGQPQRGDGVELLYDATTLGGSAAYKLRPVFWDRVHELELGLGARHDEATSVSRRLRRVGGEPYTRNFDVDFGVARLSGHLAGTLRLGPSVTLRGGARFDSFSFAVTDRNRPAADRQGAREPSSVVDASGVVVQPRLTLQWKVLPGLEWSTSAGTGARSSDAAALSQGETAPFQHVFAAETGVVHDLKGGEGEGRWAVESRASGYWSFVERDLLFDEVASRNVLQGASHRYGATLSSRLNWADFLDVSASVTYAEAWSLADGATMFMLEGASPRPYIPRWVNRLDASLRRPATVFGQAVEWGVATGGTFIAPRPLPLGKWSDPILTLDASARVSWGAWSLEVAATNLLDARYRLAEFNYASNFTNADFPPSLYAARHFSAGAPRMLFVTLGFALGELAGREDDDDHDHHAEPSGAPGDAP